MDLRPFVGQDKLYHPKHVGIVVNDQDLLSQHIANSSVYRGLTRYHD
jgi:hypothetical protein